jgi:crotonobetaine/carnitine-CoA ligase
VLLPTRDAIVPRYVLERNAARSPEGPMARFEDGSRWTWGDGLAAARSAASTLRSAGVKQGDAVAVFLPNGPDFLRAWLGTTFLGAALVPLNTAFKGGLLSHALEITDPVLAISCGDDLPARLAASSPGLRLLDVAALAEGAASDPVLDRAIEVWDTHHYMFTSGTTGPSKAARNSHLQFAALGAWATEEMGLDSGDVFLIDLPLFHGSALCMAAAAFRTGTPIAVRSMPAMNAYWETAKATGATVGFLLSSMVGFLLGKPEAPSDHDHQLRILISAPLPVDPEAFCKRFGIAQIITAYGSSEVAAALGNNGAEPLVPGSCGRARAGFSARLVDENDVAVPVGELGELTLRHELPWMITTEYLGMPAATAQAWRNGWFHTGDLMRVDDDGIYYLVDRVADALRRRGENVSTFEVEREVVAHPAVREVACLGYPSPAGDDDVKVFLVPAPEETIDPAELAAYLVERMPHFMVPRYYEVVEALPKTPSMKVQKFVLREAGNSAATWDLEVDGGKRVTRNGLVSLS